jgi:DNA-binding NarL/FixJ family response regulator
MMEGKMTVPNEPVVLIIDALPVRRLGFISVLNRLGHLAVPTKAPVTLHAPDEAGPWLDADATCEMLIYVAGAASNAERDNLERIKALRALAPDLPLMILSDSESREEIISTLNVAAQGFLYIGGNTELAVHVFSTILNRGHFPSAILPKQSGPSQPVMDRMPTPPLASWAGAAALKRIWKTQIREIAV